MTKSLCSNCRNQMTGWDGGFFGVPLTCECRIHGVTKGRKSCSEFKKRVTKSDLLNKIQSLEKENEQLKHYKLYEDNKRLQTIIADLKEEKDSLVAVIDENLLKGYHEQSLKHKEAKEKMEREDERMEASALIDVVFYWNGYVKALEELKERVSDE